MDKAKLLKAVKIGGQVAIVAKQVVEIVSLFL